MARRVILLLLLSSYALAQGPTVTIPQLGTVEGTTQQSLGGRTINSFTGIPYGQPPVGDLRFEAPLPAEPWEGTLTAVNISKPCLQLSQFTRLVTGTYDILGGEDCLYLNIYTPNLDASANLSVIVYIHPGAFMWGQGDIFGPRFLLDKDVVLVTLNYRLGPLGFLSTQSDLIPGNNGLKDQLLALQWVKTNIGSFGGNPNAVTLTGTSAGAGSVHFHLLSPKSQGLFTRAYSQSGLSLAHWFLMEKPLAKTRKIGSIVGCNQSNVNKLVKCLKGASGTGIVGASKAFLQFFYHPPLPWTPVPDFLWASDPFVPGNPYDLLKEGKISRVPFLTSYTAQEGIFGAYDFFEDLSAFKELNARWNDIAPASFEYEYTTEPIIGENFVSTALKKYYLKDEELTQENIIRYINAFTDRYIKDPLSHVLQFQSALTDVYVYLYNHRAAKPWYLPLTGINLGSSHVEDTFFFFDNQQLEDVESDPDDLAVVHLFVNILTDFAQTGKGNVPSVDWTAATKANNFTLLRVNSATNLTIEPFDYPQKRFWNSLPIFENNKFHPTILTFPILYGPAPIRNPIESNASLFS